MKYAIKEHLITLNEYINAERKNKFLAAKLKKQNTLICKLYANKLKNKINPNGLYDLQITWNVLNNRQDADNIYFAVKFILDGLVGAGILKNDGRKNIRNISHTIKTKKEYLIEIELIEVKINE